MGQLSKLETLRDSYEGNNPCLLNGKETSAFNERGSRSEATSNKDNFAQVSCNSFVCINETVFESLTKYTSTKILNKNIF